MRSLRTSVCDHGHLVISSISFLGAERCAFPPSPADFQWGCAYLRLPVNWVFMCMRNLLCTEQFRLESILISGSSRTEGSGVACGLRVQTRESPGLTLSPVCGAGYTPSSACSACCVMRMPQSLLSYSESVLQGETWPPEPRTPQWP